ncbi:uncharacterized protein LOC6533806 isoform X1 [Drosophila yakuba]|uniref:Uncharacterized protein, isoform B n=1 Tax=Drosophila yakuba TaxID=7245 RepID=A0A0R1DXD9_DROYA|nr:uncharacterized protein LOC6533806 isoform X1 [Drosophila yakuba]KRK01709.1 uncharacterized protein Dyak_GE21860, isoform B [Drosophila yakuba]
MLHCQVDESSAEQCECPQMHSENSAETSSAAELPAQDFIKPLEVQSPLKKNIEQSFKVDCKLPLHTLLSPINITDPLRKQIEIKHLLDFQCGLGELSFFGPFEHISVSELSKEDKTIKPYFIPELQMACAGQEAEQVAEKTVVDVKEPTAPQKKLPENQPINDAIITGTDERKLPPLEESNISSLAGFNGTVIEEANVTSTEVSHLKGTEEANEPISDHKNSPLLKSDIKLQPKSLGIQIPPLQIEALISPLVENPKPVPKIGLFSFLTGNKLALTPSVRLSFGDNTTSRRNIRSKEIIQQQASRSLKALISILTLQTKLEPSIFDNSHKSRSKRYEQVKNSLTFSRVFRQNIFQPSLEVESKEQDIDGNPLESGEPNLKAPSVYKEPLPMAYRLDASEGLTCNGLSVSKDSVFSEGSESDVSETQNKLFVMKKPQQVPKSTRSMADLGDILHNGRVLFSQPVRLFCFSKLKEWKRQGKVAPSHESPYRSPSFSGEGQIEVFEHHGSYYIVLHDKVSGELIIYMRVDERWRIDYMTKSSYSCRWTNINYATCREGILERIACSFREPSHAAEFVARVRNSAIQSRLECSC